MHRREKRGVSEHRLDHQRRKPGDESRGVIKKPMKPRGLLRGREISENCQTENKGGGVVPSYEWRPKVPMQSGEKINETKRVKRTTRGGAERWRGSVRKEVNLRGNKRPVAYMGQAPLAKWGRRNGGRNLRMGGATARGKKGFKKNLAQRSRSSGERIRQLGGGKGTALRNRRRGK